MPSARVASDVELHYEIDDYTDPWRSPETILMLHGSCESGAMWYGWVPHLAREFRVVRPDMRGFGKSTPMKRDYKWPLDEVIDDFAKLMQSLGIERYHVIGAKVAATIARRFAARCPERVASLVLVGAPPPQRRHKPGVLDEWLERIEREGVASWAEHTMGARLGSTFPREGARWWAQELMGRTPQSTALGFVASIPGWDVAADLARIKCPTLVITTERSALGTVDEVRAWQKQIPNSKLLALPGDSFHAAATDAERCAKAALDFICGHRDELPPAHVGLARSDAL